MNEAEKPVLNTSQGDNWEALYDQFAGKMILFAKQFVSCRVSAEDVVQEGFLRFWRTREGREERSVEAHLFGCVRWAALDWLRKSKRTRVREENYASEEQIQERGGSFRCPVEKEETAARIESALERLPSEQREVVVLKIWGELTLQEIGDALDISPNTAASRYRYAMGALKRHLTVLNYAE